MSNLYIMNGLYLYTDNCVTFLAYLLDKFLFASMTTSFCGLVRRKEVSFVVYWLGLELGLTLGLGLV